jgi:Protein of unknown function (DUF3047)
MRLKDRFRWLAVAVAMCLAACGHVLQHNIALKNDTNAATETQVVDKSFFAGWRHFTLPGKTATVYDLVRKNGRDTLSAKAGVSASMMRRDVNIPTANLDTVNFSSSHYFDF